MSIDGYYLELIRAVVVQDEDDSATMETLRDVMTGWDIETSNEDDEATVANARAITSQIRAEVMGGPEQ